MALGLRKNIGNKKVLSQQIRFQLRMATFSALSSISFSLTKVSIDGSRNSVLPITAKAVVVLVFHPVFTFECF
jgi:hypothetical protein